MLTLLMQWTWCFALAVLLELRFAVQMAKFVLLSLDLLLGHSVTGMSVGELILFPLSTTESALLWMWTWAAEGWKMTWDKEEWWEKLLWEWL